MKIGLIAFALCAAIPHAQDDRFGFIGAGARLFAHSFNTNTYALIGNQNDPLRPQTIQVLEPANDPLPGEHVVVRVGLFNARMDGYGQSLVQFSASIKKFGVDRGKCYANPLCFNKPIYTWFQPNVTAVPNIEKNQIITAIRRWRSKGVRDFNITFEIGNEPNYYVSMTPGEYAYLFRQYYTFIKAEGPTIKVVMGAFFAFELMPQDARGQVAKLIALQGERETAQTLNSDLAILYDARTFFFSLGTSALVGLGLDIWGSYAGERATRDVKNLLFSRFFSRTTKQYLTEVLNNLPSTMAPDEISFHAYPADFAQHMSNQTINSIIGTLASDLATTAYSMRKNIYGPTTIYGDPVPAIRITEMGNINPYVYGQEFVYRLYQMVAYLSEDQGLVTQWLWYKAVGQDAQFELMKSATGVEPPTTMLVWDPIYGTDRKPLPLFPARVPCAELNLAGSYYFYLAINYTSCY